MSYCRKETGKIYVVMVDGTIHTGNRIYLGPKTDSVRVCDVKKGGLNSDNSSVKMSDIWGMFSDKRVAEFVAEHNEKNK